MKIFCIGRNYVDHAKELNNPVPSEPLVFMKPNTALLLANRPFYFPDFTNDLHYEGEIVLRICKNGRSVQPEFASRYYDAVAFGIDFTARDLQDKLKAKGQPWEIAKGFDRSGPLSHFISLENLKDPQDIHFQLKKNGNLVQDGHTRDMIFNFDTLIVYLSKFFTIQKEITSLPELRQALVMFRSVMNWKDLLKGKRCFIVLLNECTVSTFACSPLSTQSAQKETLSRS
jgi:2-keto-4-pentenoate hydratase/2-oxohepta-3-ene-1,7-dioic acid hydratase in catechol pathway